MQFQKFSSDSKNLNPIRKAAPSAQYKINSAFHFIFSLKNTSDYFRASFPNCRCSRSVRRYNNTTKVYQDYNFADEKLICIPREIFGIPLYEKKRIKFFKLYPDRTRCC